MPFEYAYDHIVFQAELAGERIWMLLDTGSTNTVIDIALAKRLGLALYPVARSGNASGGHSIPIQRVNDVSLIVPHCFSVKLPVTVLDLSHIASTHGRIQGVLGYDLLSHLSMMVDKESGELMMTIRHATIGGKLQPIPITTVGNRDRIQAIVAGKPSTLTIDTGSPSGIDLSPAAWAKIKPGDAQVFTRKSVGAAGVVDNELASRLPSVTFGSTVVNDIDVRIAPQGIDGDGRVGMGVLSRYSFIIDNSHSHLWLIPVKTNTSTLPPQSK